MPASAFERLLTRVGRRQFAALAAERWRVAWLAAAGVAMLLIVLARLLSLLPASVIPPSLLVLVLLPFAAALVFTRRPSKRATARLIDDRTGGKELFLTASMIGAAPGEFQPIVVEQAERRAAEISAVQVVPFRWQRGARDILLAGCAVAMAVWLLPQLDPFKKEVARKKASDQEQRLVEMKKATEIRREQLQSEKAKDAAQVKEALAQLDKTFKEAKPREREANLKQLGEQQKEIGELWRKMNQEELRKSLDKAAQSFGQIDPKKLEKWREELKKGDVSALKKELREIHDQMQALASKPDSAQKRAQQEQIAQRLNELAQGMKQLANSPKVAQAMERTLAQMDLSKLGAMSNEAMQAAMDSLNLSEQELEQLAQAGMDAKNLEEALKNLQMAKMLAGQEKLDGSECQNCNSMSDYAALFAAKCNGAGIATGERSGMGPGIGNGAKRPEDDSAESEFKSEKSSSQLGGGKMLLEWKTKELGETGARNEEYREAVRDVKHGVAEAIQQEQVPPGYHDAIQRYFDALPEAK